MTKQYKAIARKLRDTQERFRRDCEKLGEDLRKMMLPYFKKHRLTYQAGNGIWLIEDAHERMVEDDALPEEIRNALWFEIGWNDLLGFYVPDITRKDLR